MDLGHKVLENHSVKLKVVPFKFKHYLPLLEMLDYEIEYRSLPKIGYMALVENSPIAAGFLRKIEGNKSCQIELMPNPYFGKVLQQVGIRWILNSLVLDAKELKLKTIYVLGLEESTLEETKAFGFQELAKHALILSL